jgi:hypothetical protein
MNTDKVYKPTMKNFMGIDEVRVIQDGRNEYVVLKDIFDCLGLVSTDNKGNSTWAMPKKKMMEFLEIINKECDVKTFYVRFKDKQSPKGQVREVDCLNIEILPSVVTQFKPSKRRGEEALKVWGEFMKFVTELLAYHGVYNYILTDKDKQKETMSDMIDMGGNPVITNKMVNEIMGELILTEEPKFAITKDELKVYQPRTTIDLLEVRNFVLEKFENAYMFSGSHKLAYDMTLKVALKKYDIQLS